MFYKFKKVDMLFWRDEMHYSGNQFIYILCQY